MKLKEITVEACKNLGNYENVRMTAVGVLEEGDNPSAKTDDLVKFLNYKLNKDEREKKFASLVEILEDEETSEAKKVLAQAWMDKYYQLEKEITAMEFMPNVDEQDND